MRSQIKGARQESFRDDYQVGKFGEYLSPFIESGDPLSRIHSMGAWTGKFQESQDLSHVTSVRRESFPVSIVFKPLQDSRVYVAGHRGLVGSAIVRALEEVGAGEVIGWSSSDLDLRDR